MYLIIWMHRCFRTETSVRQKKLNKEFKMFQLLRKLLCFHIYEYEQMQEIGEHLECRKCGENKTS
jgi:hypothetical protein